MKNQLRRDYAAAREAFSADERAEADKKILRLFVDNFLNYKSYFVYNSFKSEADTCGIIKALLNAGKDVYSPRVEGGKMVCVPYGNGRTHSGAYGIQEPEGEPYGGEIDVTITPLLAVDGQGYRLGYGGGYYDAYFAQDNTLRVGVGYWFQITDKNFRDGWDRPLNSFICERGIINYDE